MERHSSWFQLLAIVLVVVGLVGLAAPVPAHAMDPQLILALASAVGAIALITGYLIVANGREKQRAASLEGVYACGERESSGPMGCGGPVSLATVGAPAAPESPMVADGSSAGAVGPIRSLSSACPGSRFAGPMGCDGPVGPEPGYPSPPSAISGPTIVAVQGQ